MHSDAESKALENVQAVQAAARADAALAEAQRTADAAAAQAAQAAQVLQKAKMEASNATDATQHAAAAVAALPKPASLPAWIEVLPGCSYPPVAMSDGRVALRYAGPSLSMKVSDLFCLPVGCRVRPPVGKAVRVWAVNFPALHETDAVRGFSGPHRLSMPNVYAGNGAQLVECPHCPKSLAVGVRAFAAISAPSFVDGGDIVGIVELVEL